MCGSKRHAAFTSWPATEFVMYDQEGAGASEAGLALQRSFHPFSLTLTGRFSCHVIGDVMPLCCLLGTLMMTRLESGERR